MTTDQNSAQPIETWTGFLAGEPVHTFFSAASAEAALVARQVDSISPNVASDEDDYVEVDFPDVATTAGERTEYWPTVLSPEQANSDRIWNDAVRAGRILDAAHAAARRES